MTRLERFKRQLRQGASIMILKPLHPMAVSKILVQTALLLGITPERGIPAVVTSPSHRPRLR
jgi:hypothetical protein